MNEPTNSPLFNWRDRPLDYPLKEIEATLRKRLAEGYSFHQKFTCEHCGQRLTVEEENVLLEEGGCDQCGGITNIKKKGCNYMLLKTI